MEADISIWRKPGHFYFALTRVDTHLSKLVKNVPFLTSLEMPPFSHNVFPRGFLINPIGLARSAALACRRVTVAQAHALGSTAICYMLFFKT
jgi:hypothetical protein